MCELKNPTMSAFLNGIESSGWLKHVKAVLDASVFIAKVHDVVAVRASSVSWCNSFKFCNLHVHTVRTRLCGVSLCLQVTSYNNFLGVFASIDIYIDIL